MIIRSACQTCFQRYEILVQTSDLDLVKQVSDEKGVSAPCPRLCGGTINLVDDSAIRAVMEGRQFKEPLHLTGRELYAAVMGAGLPDELPKKDFLEPLLKAYRVAKSVVEEVDGVIYLHEIHLENGTVVHLSAGLRGAQVVKITLGRK